MARIVLTCKLHPVRRSCWYYSRRKRWIEVADCCRPGVFRVVADNMRKKDGDHILEKTRLGFTWWDGEVEDLDAGSSDTSLLLRISLHLRWQDVDLRPHVFKAPSLERLEEALQRVHLRAWCPGDL